LQKLRTRGIVSNKAEGSKGEGDGEREKNLEDHCLDLKNETANEKGARKGEKKNERRAGGGTEATSLEKF